VLAAGVAVLARVVGLDRDRAFYPTVLMVVASYYGLFAAMSQSLHTVLLESLVMAAFVIAAIGGFRSPAISPPRASLPGCSSVELPFLQDYEIAGGHD
jgi:hypothetical protein